MTATSDGDFVDEIKTVRTPVNGIVGVAGVAVGVKLVGFAGVERGDKRKRDVHAFRGAVGVGSEDTETTAPADAVGLVVKFDRPISVGTLGREFAREIFAIDGGVKIFDVFNVVEALVGEGDEGFGVVGVKFGLDLIDFGKFVIIHIIYYSISGIKLAIFGLFWKNFPKILKFLKMGNFSKKAQKSPQILKNTIF